MDEAIELAVLLGPGSANNDRRADAAEALGDGRSAESFDALVRALADKSPLVRLGAERALTRRREDGAFDALVRHLDHADPPVAIAIARSLATRTDARAEAWVRAEIERGASLDPVVEALGERRDPRAVELLGEIWNAVAPMRPKVVRALRGADLRPIEDGILGALARAFHSSSGSVSSDVVSFAASVLTSRSDALGIARPLLAPTTWRDAFEVERAKAILVNVEFAWAKLSERRIAGEEVATPDRNWRSAIAPLASSSDRDLAALARSLCRALDWFDGVEVFARVLPVDLPECDAPTDAPYPFAVLGFEMGARVGAESGEEGLKRLDVSFPDGPRLSFFSHQYAGLSCLQSRILGYPLRLRPREPDALSRLFDAWWGTSGEAMTEPDLREWEAALGAEFPRLVEGAEARIASEPRDGLGGFEGATTMAFRARTQPWRAVGSWSGPSFAPLASDDVPLSGAHARVLRTLATQVGSAPSAFVLWSSSD